MSSSRDSTSIYYPLLSTAASDKDSFVSETSTLRSKSSLYDNGYGFSTPSLGLDGIYPNEKALLSVPNTSHADPRGRRTRSPSPHDKASLHRVRRVSPHPSRNHHRSQSNTKTQLDTLAGVLGPDNAPHVAELDSIPCAGIRIPHGPFSGLLAWRLVARVHPQAYKHQTPASLKKEFALLPKSDIRHAGNMPRRSKPLTAARTDRTGFSEKTLGENSTGGIPMKERRRSLDAVTSLGARWGGRHGRTATELATLAPSFYGNATSGRASMDSFASMPLIGLVRHSMDERRKFVDDDDDNDGGWNVVPSASTPALASTLYGNVRASASTSLLTSMPPPATSQANYKAPPEAVVTNFLFDTSLGHNTISRETLLALGFSATIIDGLDISESPARPYDDVSSEMTEVPSSESHPQERYNSSASSEPKTVSLYIQNLGNPITFRLAPPGEPSRLGVQFLVESEANICMADGGRSVIMWIDDPKERKTMLQNVPKTVPLPKMSIQAKVRSLFGL